MKTTTRQVNVIDHYTNSFGQLASHYDSAEETTVTGTLEELLAHSNDQQILLKRSPETETLFPEWDTCSKFVTVYKGEPTGYAARPIDLGDAVTRALRYHIGVVEEG